MSDYLKSAQKSLRIQTVNLVESNVVVNNDVDLVTMDRSITTPQGFRSVSRVQETLLSDTDNKELWDYRYFYSVGMRLIYIEDEDISKDDNKDISKDENEDENEDVDSIVEIVSVFSAKYFSDKKLDKKEVKAFCEHSVGYHVWPYWREYVQSTCARIDLNPGFEVPFYFMPQD